MLFCGFLYTQNNIIKDCYKNTLSSHIYITDLCSFPTRFAVDIKPTKEVSEYTATIAYKLLNEGKDGRQKVDSLKMILKAEGMSVIFRKKKKKKIFMSHSLIFNFVWLHTSVMKLIFFPTRHCY